MTTSHILIVEDEGIVARDIENRLKGFGYAVCAIVSSAEEAIKKVEKMYPDLVLMDIRLKGKMDGIEAGDEIRNCFNIPVVYLTAYADDNTLQRAKITEPFGYILKPFEDKELHTAIEIALYKHKMESKLKKSEEWLATILKSIGDAVIAIDIKGLITFMNLVAEALTGWKKEDALGKNLTEVFHIIDEKKCILTESPAKKVIREGIVVLATNHTLVAKDGTQVPVDYIAALTSDDKGNVTGVVLVFHNITERKKAEEEIRSYQKKLRSLALKLTIAEEQERRHLAVELHDSIGQLLALSKIKLGELREVAGSTDIINSMQEFLDQAVQKVRSLTFQLSPPILYELGFEAALQWLCEEMHKRHDIQVTLRLDSQSNLLDNELSIFLFRAVRELLMNVVKHAQVHKAQVSLHRKGESLHISVEDKGVGFDPSTLEIFSDRSSRFGLFSIRERLHYFRGEMTIVSQPGQGSRVTLVVPLKAAKKSTGGT